MDEKISERKIVPVVGRVSAGKSNILNILYGMNFLECKAGIGTKFINILRYNPKIEEPRFYHLIAKKAGEKYIFYKDSLSPEIVGKQNIVEENKRINKILEKDKNFEYENIFYMTEINESPVIKDEKYLMTHDLCDIPGLSEYQEKSETLTKEQNTKEGEAPVPASGMEKLSLLKKELGLDDKEETKGKKEKNEKLDEYEIITGEENTIQEDSKNEDDLFYDVKIQKNSYIYEIFTIIKDYIDGAIIILDIEKYYLKDNFEMIAMLHKIINKQITNCLVILNKMDLSQNPEGDIDNCKAMFLKYFPSCKTFNLNLNTFTPISSFQLENELLLNKSFKHLLNYHFNKYYTKMQKELINNTPSGKSFIDHMRELIKTIPEITKEEIEKKVNEAQIISDEEIIKIINEIKDNFAGKNVNYGITDKDFDELDNEGDYLDLDAPEENNENNHGNVEDVNPSLIIKMIYVLQKENKLIPPLSKENQELLDYFKYIDKPKDIFIDYKKKLLEDANAQTKLNKNIINKLRLLIMKIENSGFIGKEIRNIINEIWETINNLERYDVIFLPFLGPSNAGKSTIINNIIGYNVLPTSLNECTKRGIIIGYGFDHQNSIILKKILFKEKKILGETKYFFMKEEGIIAIGLKAVQDCLKGLNKTGFTDKEEDAFYYIETKIKLYDDLGLDNYLKRIIYLIDFPGFGTGNIFENSLYQKVMSICNSFIFVVRNSIINETMNRNILNNLFTQAMEQKHNFASKFIKSCLFILNNDKNQKTTEEDLDKAKEEIKGLIKRIDKEDINLCFFNAKFYSNYLYNLNYFFNIYYTINEEYRNFCEWKYNMYQYPEFYNYKQYKSFGDYLHKILVDKIKNEGFGTKINKVKNVDQKIISEVNEIINELGHKNPNLGISNKIKTIIPSIFSFARENLINLQTYKESNIGGLQMTFLNQINYINNNMQDEIKVNLNKIIKTLDYFFGINFSERKKDLQTFEKFKNDIKDIQQKLELFQNNSEEEAKSIKEKYGTTVKTSLEEKRENLEILLKKKNLKQIQEEVDKEMKSKIGALNEQIQNFFSKIDYNSYMFYQLAQESFNKFTSGNMKLENIQNFKDYFAEKVVKKGRNISEEIYSEIKSCLEQGMSKIWERKTFFDYISSFFSNVSYLTNVLDIIIQFYCRRIDYIFKLLTKSFKNYTNSIINGIKSGANIISIRYTEVQKKEWENLCSIYKGTKEDINKSLKQYSEIMH